MVNAEQRDLARRLADAIRYGPQPRRAHVIERSPRMRCVRDKDGALIPDLTDDSTGGILLGMLGPGYLTECAEKARGCVWSVRLRGYILKEAAVVHVGGTLAEACARALLAEWGEP